MSTMRVNARKSIELMKCEANFANSTGTMQGIRLAEDNYRVFSYGVLIAEVMYEPIYDEAGKLQKYNRKVWITPTKYSVTTSKHTTYARRALVI